MKPLTLFERSLPRLRFTEAEFMELLEYSYTLPTGTTVGKRWRKFDGRRWWIGEFYEIEKADRIGIRWYRPVIVLEAILAPELPPWWLLCRWDRMTRMQLAEAIDKAAA